MSLPPDFEERFRGFEEVYRGVVEREVTGRYFDIGYVVSKLESLYVELRTYVVSRLAGVKDVVCEDVYGFVDRLEGSVDFSVLAIVYVIYMMYRDRDAPVIPSRFDLKSWMADWLEMVLCR